MVFAICALFVLAAVAQAPIRMGLPVQTTRPVAMGLPIMGRPVLPQCPVPPCAMPMCMKGFRLEGLGVGAEFSFDGQTCRSVSCPRCVPSATCTDVARRCAALTCPVGQELFTPPSETRTDRRTGKACSFPSCPACRPCLSCPQPKPVCIPIPCAFRKCDAGEISVTPRDANGCNLCPVCQKPAPKTCADLSASCPDGQISIDSTTKQCLVAPCCDCVPRAPICPRMACAIPNCAAAGMKLIPGSIGPNGCPVCPRCAKKSPICPAIRCADPDCPAGTHVAATTDENGCTMCPHCAPDDRDASDDDLDNELTDE